VKKSVFVIGVLLVAGLLLGTGTLSSQWQTVTAGQLLAWMDSPEPPLVLDVRGRADYHARTIVGALNGGVDPMGYLPDGEGGKVVLLLPDNAADTVIAAWVSRLENAGHQVSVLQRGLVGWIEAGGNTETPEFSYTRPGSVPFLIPRGLCEGGEPAHIFE